MGKTPGEFGLVILDLGGGRSEVVKARQISSIERAKDWLLVKMLESHHPQFYKANNDFDQIWQSWGEALGFIPSGEALNGTDPTKTEPGGS